MATSSASVSRQTLRSLGVKRVTSREGITEYQLKDNGLTVLLKNDHTTPVVTFMVLYNCGSRNEGAGTTGSAHFFEHLMFKGTPTFDPKEGNGPMELFARVGSVLNANTSYDRTRYFEVVPAEQLELCVRVEADRMRNLKNRKSDRDSEMTVVRNEFERGENSPGSALFKAVMSAAYTEHPYHYPVIGARSDVEGVPMSKMVEFYDQYYWPNNATVIIVGDFDSTNALQLIHKYFGKISRSPEPIPPMYTVEPPQQGERRIEVRRSGSLPELLSVYHIPEGGHQDEYALAALAQILGDADKSSSRLYNALVERAWVNQCYAHPMVLKDPGVMMIGASLTPGSKLEEVEAAIDAEIARLCTELVTDEELERVKTANRKGTVLNNDDQLSYTNVLSNAVGLTGWQYSPNYDANFDKVTKEDIQRVAVTYLQKSNRTVGWFIPTEGAGAPQSKPVATKPNKARKNKQRRLKIKATNRPSNFAELTKTTVLPNGLKVSVIKRGKGSVAVNCAVAAGSYFSGSNSMLAAVTADMLTAGSTRFSKQEIGRTMAEMAADLDFRCGQFAVTSGALVCSEDFPKFVELLADVLYSPSFQKEELDKRLPAFKGHLSRQLEDTGARAYIDLMRAAYPEGHPLRSATVETELSDLDKVDSAAMGQFHKEHYGPKTTVLTVVGDIDPDQAIATIQQHFGCWTGAERKPIVIPTANSAASGDRTIKVNIADKASVDIRIGHATELSRTSKDYFAARIASNALGADTIADRLGKVVRVQNGLTYGIHCSFSDSSFGAAAWYIDVSVNPANVDKALALIKGTVAEYLLSGISAEELEDKVMQAKGNLVVGLRSSAGIGRLLCSMEFLGLGAKGIDDSIAGYDAVTKADVDAAISKYFDLDKSFTVLAGTLS